MIERAEPDDQYPYDPYMMQMQQQAQLDMQLQSPQRVQLDIQQLPELLVKL